MLLPGQKDWTTGNLLNLEKSPQLREKRKFILLTLQPALPLKNAPKLCVRSLKRENQTFLGGGTAEVGFGKEILTKP